MAQGTFQHFDTAATHAIEADSDGNGIHSTVVLRRILVNGGASGTLTLSESDDTSSGATDSRIATITVPDDGAGNALPFTQECGFVVSDTLLITASAATDITIVFERTP